MGGNVLKSVRSKKGSPPYIHISEKNIVHVMIPLTGMDDTGIGLDNTCRAALALKDFFGQSTNKDKSGLFELNQYKKELETDISAINNHPLGAKQSAQKRLQELRFILGQVENYIGVLDKINATHVNDLGAGMPQYPDVFRRLFRRQEANIYAICLAPQHKDGMLRFTELYWFEVERPERHWATPANENDLGAVLRAEYQKIRNFKLPSSRDMFLQELQSNIQEKVRQGVREKDINLSLPLSKWSSFLATYLAQHDASHAVKLCIRDSQINEKLDYGGWDLNKPVREKDVPDLVEALFNSAGCEIPESTAFVRVNSSRLTQQKADELSILTQFFIAEVNIYARIHNLFSWGNWFSLSSLVSLFLFFSQNQPLSLVDLDFGKLLDKNGDLAQQLAKCVKAAIESQKSIESAIFDFINQYYEAFNLNQKLNNDQKKDISAIFNKHYSVIAESDHKDEFIFLNDTNPSGAIFHLYQGALCCDFTTWYQEATLGVIGPWHSFYAAHQERASMPVRLPHTMPEHLTGDITIREEELGEDKLLRFTCALIYEVVLCFAIEACLSSASEKKEALTLLSKYENDRSLKIETTLMLFGIDVQRVQFHGSDSFTVETYKPEAESQLKYVVQQIRAYLGESADPTIFQLSKLDKPLPQGYSFRLISKVPGQSFAKMVEEARAKRRQAVAPPPDKHLCAAFIPGVGSAVVTGSLFALGVGSFILANTVSASWIVAASAGFVLAGATCPFLGVALITLALVMGMGIMYHRNKEVEGSISNWVSKKTFGWGPSRKDNVSLSPVSSLGWFR